QIENQSLDVSIAVMFEIGDRLLESIGRVATELADSYIADAVRLELRFDRFDLDDLPGERDVKRRLLAAQDCEGDRRSGIAPQEAHHLAQRHTPRARVIDQDNLVARLEPRMCRRSPIER